MESTKATKAVRFPENRKYKPLVRYGEASSLSDFSGYARITIYEILSGKRRMTYKFKLRLKAWVEAKEKMDAELLSRVEPNSLKPNDHE